VNGQKAAEGRIEQTVPLVFSGDEGADVGMDNETNVTDAYKEGDNRFTGKIHKVTIELK
jgi:arylsulfatase